MQRMEQEGASACDRNRFMYNQPSTKNMEEAVSEFFYKKRETKKAGFLSRIKVLLN